MSTGTPSPSEKQIQVPEGVNAGDQFVVYVMPMTPAERLLAYQAQLTATNAANAGHLLQNP